MTRKLDGLRRVQDGEWEWGCWRISRFPDGEFFAIDDASFTPNADPWPARSVGPCACKEMVNELYENGADALTTRDYDHIVALLENAYFDETRERHARVESWRTGVQS